MSARKKTGIILMNLGSPDSTEVPDVRNYLNEFLMDKRVIDYPWLFRKLLVSGIIAPTRAPRSAEAYKSVWTEEGSPLIVLTKELQSAVADSVPEPVEIAMRYGKPAMKSAFDNLLKRIPGLEHVIAVPLYPHYAMSSYETAVEFAKEVHKKNRYSFTMEFVKPFYDEEHFIHALSESIRPYLANDYDQLLMSYHGLPERHMRKADITGKHCLRTPDCCNVDSPAHAHCYRHQCFTTTRLVAKALQVPDNKIAVSFQSRLGREEWLKPYTAIRLAELPKEGIKKLVIACPAFVSDCLETLEEIAVEGKHIFMEAGGESFTLVPCLNINPLWVKVLAGYLSDINNGNKAMVLK
ncbi:MAG TPA: ferrochelatase [Flavitalea sp.]|nr:ferrochelatase [Flavitalea sp.]